jgi:hypothetical protein
MDAKGLETLLVVTLIAALAPVVCAALPRLRIPQVAFLYAASYILRTIIKRSYSAWLGFLAWRRSNRANVACRTTLETAAGG